MNKRLLGGVILAVLAAAATATGVVVVAQQGQPAIGPSKALRPSEITKVPPGTPAVGLTEPVEHGPFRVLPAGAAPPPPCGVQPPSGAEEERVVVQESAALGDFVYHDLFFVPPYIPDGWELTEIRAETVMWDDGTETGSVLILNFEQEEYFPIQIGRLALAPGCKVERVEYLPEGSHAYTLGEIRGVPVLYLHQAPDEKIQADLWVEFVSDDVLTRVSSIAIDFDELIRIADNLIQLQMGLIESPPVPSPIPEDRLQSERKEDDGGGVASSSSTAIDTVAIDTNVNWFPQNTATQLGTRQSCSILTVGGTRNIDVTVDSVPPVSGSEGGIKAFQFTLKYDSSKVRIVASDPEMLLSANEGSSLSAFGDATPDEDGSFVVAEADFGDPTIHEDGEGVLARITLAGLAEGISDLMLDDVILVENSNEPYAVGDILDAQVAVGQACP